jgi:HEPN domain-containing protein
MKNNFSRLSQRWIKRAEDDLLFAETGLKEGFYNQVCFLSHQAIEKYLKAFLIKVKGSIEKKERIHDLAKLAKICEKFGLDLSQDYEKLRMLSEFYIPVRYPDASLKEFDKNTAKEALEIAREIITKIKEKIRNNL